MDLILYHRWYCPYSKRVRDFIEQNNLQSQIQYRELDESIDNIERLVRLTGGQQVPCLVINGRPKLESEHIIEWLRENLLSQKDANVTG